MTVYAIDANAYVHRAAARFPEMDDARGDPYEIVYGFGCLLLPLVRTLERNGGADSAALVFDGRGSRTDSWRHALDPEYKAHRRRPRPRMAEQRDGIRELGLALGFGVLELEATEADDVMASLAARAAPAERVTIISQDKDLAQMVDGSVTLADPLTGQRLDAAGVVLRYGVRPAQIPDYLALVGDAVDNIRGVPNVGPKTARELLREYRDLEAALAAAERGAMLPRLARALTASAARARLALKLATVDRGLALPALGRFPGRDDADLAAIAARHGFSWAEI